MSSQRDSSQQNGDDEAAEWTRLGTFAGGALTFVRELLADEGLAYREELVPARDGQASVVLWVASGQHARAVALLAAGQSDAKAAVLRETAVLAADAARAAEEEVHAAERAERNRAQAERRAARIAARRAARDAAEERRRHARADAPRAPSPPLDHSTADSALRVLGFALVAFIIFVTMMILVGERWGTRKPAVPKPLQYPIPTSRLGR